MCVNSCTTLLPCIVEVQVVAAASNDGSAAVIEVLSTIKLIDRILPSDGGMADGKASLQEATKSSHCSKCGADVERGGAM